MNNFLLIVGIAGVIFSSFICGREFERSLNSKWIKEVISIAEDAVKSAKQCEELKTAFKGVCA